MGYFTLDFKKAKGASDARMSDHIERRVIASNVDPTRTHLNRELVQLPKGVTERDEAIAHRIKSAGIKRKITPDQVRAIRVMLSGTHEDMMKIQQDGRIDEWCDDSMQWLHKTFGKENTVSAVLHMDETTPHIHATIVPIVMGERRKAKQKKQTEGKRTYRKKTDAARLCADDVLNRDRLVAYHDDYAKVMERYGLQRGVRGSEARHTTTAQYYRDLKRQTGELETDVQQLQSEKKAAEKRLLQIKREIGTERLEVVKTEAKTAIIAKVGSLLGSGEIKELKQENQQLRDEVVARDESIERLQIMMQYIHEHYAEEITLEMIAASVSISKSGALHIFQSGIHCSPVAYLIQYRLAQAARQLYTTQKSVASIANETGFTSAGYFCRKFRQYYNRSPKEYRKKKTEESS